MLLMGAMTMTAMTLTAQTAPKYAPGSGTLEVSVTYGAMLANVIAGKSFWMQNGSVEVAGQFYRGLSAVADVGGMHTSDINSSGVGLDIVTATFGPRYTWELPKKRYNLFGQFLIGEANGFHGLFPSPNGAADSADSMALEAGGGMNVALSRRVALRAFEVNWLRTQLPNSTTNVQNNVRFGAGIVFRLR
uniref:Outer membrane protein beta-barrel domain-containing protein n=1 Tax=Paracidobacterium acidisoli TaxID=2303751 RepID=A0A372IQI9_9BACT